MDPPAQAAKRSFHPLSPKDFYQPGELASTRPSLFSLRLAPTTLWHKNKRLGLHHEGYKVLISVLASVTARKRKSASSGRRESG